MSVSVSVAVTETLTAPLEPAEKLVPLHSPSWMSKRPLVPNAVPVGTPADRADCTLAKSFTFRLNDVASALSVAEPVAAAVLLEVNTLDFQPDVSSSLLEAVCNSASADLTVP